MGGGEEEVVEEEECSCVMSAWSWFGEMMVGMPSGRCVGVRVWEGEVVMVLELGFRTAEEVNSHFQESFVDKKSTMKTTNKQTNNRQ